MAGSPKELTAVGNSFEIGGAIKNRKIEYLLLSLKISIDLNIYIIPTIFDRQIHTTDMFFFLGGIHSQNQGI